MFFWMSLSWDKFRTFCLEVEPKFCNHINYPASLLLFATLDFPCLGKAPPPRCFATLPPPIPEGGYACCPWCEFQNFSAIFYFQMLPMGTRNTRKNTHFFSRWFPTENAKCKANLRPTHYYSFHTLTWGSQSIQWLTIKDRPLILLRTAYHLIALPTAHPPPEDPQFTGDAIVSPPNTMVGTSDCKLKLDTEDGLKMTVSASNRERKTCHSKLCANSPGNI